MGTSFDTIIDKFYYKIEKDDRFWNLFNVTDFEILSIAHQRAIEYLKESIYVISSYCESDVNWFDYDETLETFNFELSQFEINLLVCIMFEKHMERDISMLKAFEVNFTPSDLKTFSPSNSRKSFMEMYSQIQQENRVLLDAYESKDRLTGKRKSIDHSKYEY